MAERVAAAVVLYNPDPHVAVRIRDYASLVDRLFLVDNSDAPVSGAIAGLRGVPNVRVLEMGGNRGIGAALNRAAEAARREGFLWLLTMDQDASLERHVAKRYFAAFQSLVDRERIAVVAPLYDENERPGGVPSTSTVDVDMVMMAYNLLNLKIHQEVGEFDEGLFIDEVDHDYCLKCRLRGYRIVRLLDVLIPHRPGELITVGTKRGLITFWKHAPERLYYMARNYIILRRRYKENFPHIIEQRRERLLVVAKQTFRFQRRKVATVYHLFRGLAHGLLGRRGK